MDPERAATLVAEYLSGDTMREVAARHQVSTKAVQRAMRQMGAQTRTPQERTGAPARVEQWAASYAQGVTTAEIAARAGVSEQTVRQRLRQHGVALPRPARPQPRKRDERTVSALVEQYIAGATLAKIGRDLGVSGARVQQVMKDAGAPLGQITAQHRAVRRRLRDAADREAINRLLTQDPAATVQELAESLGLAPGRVKRLLGPEAPARRRPPRPPAPDGPFRAVPSRRAGLRKGPWCPTPRAALRALLRGLGGRAGGHAVTRDLVRRFGTWAKAVEAAGFRPAVSPRRPYPRLSHEEAVAVVAAFIADERAAGRPPNSRFYPAWARAQVPQAWRGWGCTGGGRTWLPRRSARWRSHEVPDLGPTDPDRCHPARRGVRGSVARLAGTRPSR